MSGSSMDGVDLAFCEFSKDHSKWVFEIIQAETLPYPADLHKKIEHASLWSLDGISELDRELGYYYALLLNEFHGRYGLIPDLIASHGHTILHEPQRGITVQAGHGGIISELTGITVVNDFRSADVAQGGQGAPLVPVGDRLLFEAYDACLNLGGFANISYDNEAGRRVAYDLCPANMALNWIAGLLGQKFDEGGTISKQGKPDEELLSSLNKLEYYSHEPPKSLGREWFLKHMLPLLEQEAFVPSDLMATMVEHIACQTASGINTIGIKTVLITGGGALNKTLVDRIRYHTSAQLEIPHNLLVNYKEALIFALLGLLRIRGEINCLASATGGKKDLSTGTIYTTNNRT